MNLTPWRLRLLATKVAPSTSAMSSLLSEWGRLHDIALDLVLDPVGVDRRRRARHAGRSVSVALSGPNRARRRELLAQDLRRKAIRRRRPLVLPPWSRAKIAPPRSQSQAPRRSDNRTACSSRLTSSD